MWGTRDMIHRPALPVAVSPRMWGTPYVPLPDHGLDRFIPTHVGNAHPSMQRKTSISGSSPRMWGTPQAAYSYASGNSVHPHACGERLLPPLIFSSVRFIPTHVGNATRPGTSRCRIAVHPHACGERLAGAMIFYNDLGSSPRMWGTRCHAGSDAGRFRFIPTHVGNANSGPGCVSPVTVHPHACGERGHRDLRARGAGGSSPRMWGTPEGSDNCCCSNRFIPTHVGNAPRAPERDIPESVHPHACGERTIPRIYRPRMPVHPHACGERRLDTAPSPHRSGSSPRMWGTPPRLRSGSGSSRFIPTHVGNAYPAGVSSTV